VARMNESARRPAPYAVVPPVDATAGAGSTARLVTPRAERLPEPVGRLAEEVGADFGTAPTLLLTPTGPTDGANGGASTAVTPPVEEQPWFRSGTTVRPPSMRPPADSAALLAVRNGPNPRVLKLVAGVIASCLFIVAAAGAKVLYLALRGPVAAPAATVESTSPGTQALAADPPTAAPVAREPATGGLADPARRATAPSSAPPSATLPMARSTAPRPSPSPTRVTTKPSTRRVPVPKKVGRIH
jgi:hypothetical protein